MIVFEPKKLKPFNRPVVSIKDDAGCEVCVGKVKGGLIVGRMAEAVAQGEKDENRLMDLAEAVMEEV